MRTRSRSRRNRHRNVTELHIVVEEPVVMPDDEPPKDDAAPDLRTMEELCQPTMLSRGGPIAPSTLRLLILDLSII